MQGEQEGFYVTRYPPGRAEGAASWETYMSHSTEQPTETDEPEIDYGFDEDGNPRPLDWFFNNNK